MISTFGNNSWSSYGVIVTNEQTEYQQPGQSHSSRHASMELRYAELTGDATEVANAIRELSWATYMVNNDGENTYPDPSFLYTWLTDGYGDYVRHYLRSMAAAPYLAPDDQDHMLRTSSVIQGITYQDRLIFYETFDNHSQELLRINTFLPAGVTADGVALPRLNNISDLDQMEGYTFGAQGDLPTVMRIRHDYGNQVIISGLPGDIVPITGVNLTGTTVGSTDVTYPFIATVQPPTATQPITYVWQASEQAPITITDGASVTADFAWSIPGSKVITVTATNLVGSAVETHNVTIEQPIAGLTASNDSPTGLGEPTTLQALIESGSNVSYSWDLGDGSTANGALLTHVYPDTGNFTATVTASNLVSTVTAATDITITDVPTRGLTADNDSPTRLGESTTLMATISEGSHVSYTWDFGDGENGVGVEVTHIYPDVGVYTATVAASNSVSEATATTSVIITDVTDVPIEGLSATNDSPTQLGSLTTLEAAVTAGSNVTYSWDFGDGGFGVGAEVTHIYPEVGVYTATVTASNSVSEATATTSVAITDVPIAGLSATNNSPSQIGESTSLYATIIAGSHVSYTWDFGDGTYGNGAGITYVYPSVGGYTATVFTSNRVSSETATTSVSITDVRIAGLSVANNSPNTIGETTSITTTITIGSNVNFNWDFGDQSIGVGQVVTHTYPATGVYTATVTAANSAGQASAQTGVQVVETIHRIYLPGSYKGENNFLDQVEPLDMPRKHLRDNIPKR